MRMMETLVFWVLVSGVALWGSMVGLGMAARLWSEDKPRKGGERAGVPVDLGSDLYRRGGAESAATRTA
jgi:hypothetical protein